MKALRFVCGILLAAVGVEMIFAGILMFFQQGQEVPGWLALVVLFGLGIAPLGGAILLLREKSHQDRREACPKCGGNEHELAGMLHSKYNPLLFYFGGWIFSTLWGASREQQVRCVNCDALYLIQTRDSRTARIIFLIVLVILVIEALGSYYLSEG